MQSGFHWQRVTNLRNLPISAVRGGHDTNGDEIYIGKASYGAMKLPAKVIPKKGKSYVAHGGVEHEVTNVEILCERSFKWVHSSNGTVPTGAVEGGMGENHERMYIGRVSYNGSQTVGKIHPSHRCLYISYGGSEHKFTSYEILIYN